MNAATFDTYAAAKRLRDAGFDERQAEAAVSMVRDAAGADREHLATKADLAELKAELKGDVEALRAATKADLAELKGDLKADLAELKGDVEALRAATKADLAAAIAGLEARTYRALWVQAVAIIGTQLAIAGFVVHLLSQP